ncbi:MAG: two-component system, OmpR family, response regulator [Candidatus Peregrinibacteria bacterium Gr01-1014_25]|nr:MAG: two-component system, OmpR family, response regulator [Candidatus Peregrinibacteria bacterium Gr01-1014_25]
MAKGTILIAEDDAALRNLYMKKFGLAGFDLKTCEDGEQCLIELQSHSPDVLILDVHMPKMDGMTVLEHLPKEKRSYPVIVLTNFDDAKVRERGRQLAVDDFFVKKDMTIRKLVEMVEAVLAKRQR